MEPLITPVMIVRDEERYLPGALNSLRAVGGVFAPTCVYDTGSVDATREIAAAAGAHVEQGYWDDDFARARNAANAMAATSWVLVVDADERVTAAPDAVEKMIAAADADGLEALAIQVDDRRGQQVHNTAPSIRLFRKDKAQYRNRLHEVVVSRVGGTLRAAHVEREVLRLDHTSYGLTDKSDTRAERNARIAELEVEDRRREGDVVGLCAALVNRGRSLAIGDDWAGAERDWIEARQLKENPSFAQYAGELLARRYAEEGRTQEVAVLLRELGAEAADPMLLSWIAAEAFAAANRPQATLRALQDLRKPRSALGEELALAPIRQTRMLAAAKVGENEVALSDAVHLMAVDGVYGFARLALLLHGGEDLSALAQRLLGAGGNHLQQMADEFSALGGTGQLVGQQLSLGAPGEFALGRDW